MIFFYRLPPIDFGWECLKDAKCIRNLDEILLVAKHHAKIFWEGDFTEGPSILMLAPNPDDFRFPIAIVWKQKNNGSVFVISEEPIEKYEKEGYFCCSLNFMLETSDEIDGGKTSFFADIKESVDIEFVISQYVNLKSKGKYLVGRCPFHDDKSDPGSFTVTPEKKIFYCFWCHSTGDVIAFIAKMLDINQRFASKIIFDHYITKKDDKKEDKTTELKSEN